MNIFGKTTLIAAAVTMAVLAGGQPAAAQSKIELRVADYLPPNHYIVRYATKYFMDKVTAATDGRVQFKHFPSQQLGKAKDLLALTQSGVADLAGVVPSFVSDKLPLGGVVELPGLYRGSCHGTKAYAELVRGDGIVAKGELEPANVVILFPVVVPPYVLFSKSEKLASLEDIKGLKVRSLGGGMALTFKKLGAAPVRMASPEIYESLSRGTVDSVAYSYSPLLSNGFHELVKSALTDVNFGGGAINYVMSAKRWRALPEDVRKVMMDVGSETISHACSQIDAEIDEAKAKVEASGVKYFELSPADKARMDGILTEVAEEWVADLEKRGKAAREALAAFKAALSKS